MAITGWIIVLGCGIHPARGTIHTGLIDDPTSLIPSSSSMNPGLCGIAFVAIRAMAENVAQK